MDCRQNCGAFAAHPANAMYIHYARMKSCACAHTHPHTETKTYSIPAHKRKHTYPTLPAKQRTSFNRHLSAPLLPRPSLISAQRRCASCSSRNRRARRSSSNPSSSRLSSRARKLASSLPRKLVSSFPRKLVSSLLRELLEAGLPMLLLRERDAESLCCHVCAAPSDLIVYACMCACMYVYA